MIRKFVITAYCVAFILAGISFAKAETKKDILGLYVGMSHEKAIKVLQEIGKKAHDERKQQEIWKLKNDKFFSHLIVSFDKDYKKVRFVTAKALENGQSLRYTDVLDVKKAKAQVLPNNYKYVLLVPANGKQAGYRIIARGKDKDYLTYFAVEELTPSDETH